MAPASPPRFNLGKLKLRCAVAYPNASSVEETPFFHHPHTTTMRLPLLGLLLGLISGIAALSTQGSRLLVVIEDDADKSKYSHFWSDLEGKKGHTRYHTLHAIYSSVI